MEVKIEDSWRKRLESEFDKSYFTELAQFVEEEYATQTIYPNAKNIFKAFEICPFEATKVVILGQDPYHGPAQADGLCFSVQEGMKPPPSLINIFKEIREDVGKPIPTSGDLTRWAKQGVLLLNATLTVRASSPASHQGRGWEIFTDAVIKLISDQKEKVVFILWGAYAQKKGDIINASKHLIIKSAHPSPFSVYKGFFGSKPFSKTNAYLKSKGLAEVDW
jgi:uracil-DNA glycosylase